MGPRLLISAARGHGRVVIVEGPAGIGKTALLASGRWLAGTVGLEPLAARGAELERSFGFGVVLQRLEPAVQGNGNGDAGLAFVGAARHAASLFDVEVPDAAALPAGPEAAFAVLHSLYRLTGNLARRRPLADSMEAVFVIPVRLEECQVPRRISDQVQYVDLFPDWEKGVQRLAKAIQRTARERPVLELR